MKDYWVDFSASIKVRAENEEKAKELALQILDDMDSPSDYYDSHLNYIEIDKIEEV